MKIIPVVIAASLFMLSAPAFAESSKGASEYTPGDKMQDTPKKEEHGASTYAPGQEKKEGENASKYSPGHEKDQGATGSGTGTKSKY